MLDNDKITPDQQGEYKLKEEEGLQDYFGESSRSGGNINKLQKAKAVKRLLIPLGLVVVIIIIYNVLGWISSRKADSEVTQEQEVAKKQQAMVVTTKTPSVVRSTAEIPEVETPAPKVSNEPTINQKLDILATQAESNKNQLVALDDKLSQTQAALSDLTVAINDLGKSINGLAQEMQQRVAPQPKPKAVAKAVTPKRAVYNIKAIVPGRAWLESDEGDTISVKVGDTLVGYGKIVMISTKQGMVVTSSGSIIQYGSNDF